MKIVWNIVLTILCAFLAALILGAALPICFYLNPPPGGVPPKGAEEFAKYVAGLPATAFIVPVLSHFLGTFVGCLLAARFAAYQSIIPAAIVGLLFLLGGIENFRQLGVGPWFALVDLPVYPLATLLGIWLGRPKIDARAIRGEMSRA